MVVEGCSFTRADSFGPLDNRGHAASFRVNLLKGTKLEFNFINGEQPRLPFVGTGKPSIITRRLTAS